MERHRRFLPSFKEHFLFREVATWLAVTVFEMGLIQNNIG